MAKETKKPEKAAEAAEKTTKKKPAAAADTDKAVSSAKKKEAEANAPVEAENPRELGSLEPDPAAEEKAEPKKNDAPAKQKTAHKASPETVRRRKEEQARKSRRLSRQILGVVLAVLIVVGAVSIVRRGIELTATLLDNTAEKEEYEYRIAPMVWFDLLPFEDPLQIDENSLKEVIVFGLIDNLGAEIQHDGNGSSIVPTLEVDRYAAELFGPDFTFASHETFTSITQGITYVYDETQKAYIVAGTGLELMYAPTVIDVKHESGGIVRVTVGYVSTKSKEGNLLPSLDYEHPVRYMDYMFQRSGSEYFLFSMRNNTTLTVTPASSAAVLPASAPEEDSSVESLPPPVSTEETESAAPEADSDVSSEVSSAA